MEWLKNLFTPINERVRSPFYGSFIISWLIFNWRVVYLLFSKDDYFKGIHKLDYIGNFLDLSIWHNWGATVIFPLILALIYLFVIPVVDLALFGYLETNRQQKLQKKYTITKAYTVLGERHIELLLSFNTQKDRLAKLNDELFEKQEDFNKREIREKELERSLSVAEYEKNELKQKIILITDNRLNQIFNGKWVCKWRQTGKATQWEREEFTMDSNNKYMVDNGNGTADAHHEILQLTKNADINNIGFIKMGLTSRLKSQFRLVNLSKKGEKYIGTENFVQADGVSVYFDVVYMPINEEA